jgi:crescentin
MGEPFMTKLSNLFSRKASNGSALTPLDISSNEKGLLDGATNAETLSEIGSRIGEENEFLRGLLNDTGRKINELDDLKDSFHKLVQPFNNTLRALEQEKSENIGLANRLSDAQAAYETLRAEFYAIEKRATVLEAETEKQRESIERARETNHVLESKQVELNDGIRIRSTKIAELEIQLEQETSQRRSLSEMRRTLQEQIETAEKHILGLESEIAASREKLVLIEDDKRSLQTSLEHSVNETARLSRSLTEADNMLATTRTQLSKIETSFSEAFTERGRLAAALDELKEQHQAERNSLNMRLDALQSRAATAERLLTEARQTLIARAEEVRAFDRRFVEASIARNNAEKRLTQIEALREKHDRQIHEMEHERTALAERTSTMTKTLKAREAALARAEEKIAALTERNGQLEADLQISRTNIEKRVEELNTALQRERMERAVLDGALEAARTDNVRLQKETADLRTLRRRSGPADDAKVGPGQPANDQSLGLIRFESVSALTSKNDEG